MLVRRALDRGLKLRCFQRNLNRRKSLRHLRRQVWEKAEIEGVRHALSYPIRDRRPNKTKLRPTH